MASAVLFAGKATAATGHPEAGEKIGNAGKEIQGMADLLGGANPEPSTAADRIINRSKEIADYVTGRTGEKNPELPVGIRALKASVTPAEGDVGLNPKETKLYKQSHKASPPLGPKA